MSGRTDQESRRLETLDRYDLLDTPDEAAFDRITRIAAQLIGTPIALISLVDQDRQWFKSHHGLTAQETPRSLAFCSHAIADAAPFVINDALTDPRFRDNALVTGDLHLRFYLGVPLRMHDGQMVGTLCALDQVPRKPSPEQISGLADLARVVVDQIELRHIATIDTTTGALTRRALEAWTGVEIECSHRASTPMSFAVMNLDRFAAINDTYGHGAGDAVLQMAASAVMADLRTVDVIGRVGGDTFLIVMPGTGPELAMAIADQLRRTLEALRMPFAGEELRITGSFGVTGLAARDHRLGVVLDRANQALVAAKTEGRNRVALVSPD